MKAMLLMALVAVGCAHVNPVMGPDGTEHLSVSCANNVNICYRGAAKACPSGYDVVDKNESSMITPIGNGNHIGTTEHTWLIKCRGAAVATAMPVR